MTSMSSKYTVVVTGAGSVSLSPACYKYIDALTSTRIGGIAFAIAVQRQLSLKDFVVSLFAQVVGALSHLSGADF